MPDRDAILRAISNLQPIDEVDYGHDLNLLTSVAWHQREHDAQFWLTNEGFLNNPRNYVLRTEGEPRGRAQIERDFTTQLGKPDMRTSEIGIPVVEVATWRVDRINQVLSRSRPRKRGSRR